jgi:hypothetical protein
VFNARAVNHYGHLQLSGIAVRLRGNTVALLDGRPVPLSLAIKPGRRFYSAESILISVRSETADRWEGRVKAVDGDRVTLSVSVGKDAIGVPLVVEDGARFLDGGRDTERAALLQPGSHVRVLPGRVQTVDALSADAEARAIPPGVKALAMGRIREIASGGSPLRIRVEKQVGWEPDAEGTVWVDGRCMFDGTEASPSWAGLYEGNALVFVRGEKRPGMNADNLAVLPYGLERVAGRLKAVGKTALTLAVTSASGTGDREVPLEPDVVFLLDGRPVKADALAAGQDVIVFAARVQTVERVYSGAERIAALAADGPAALPGLRQRMEDADPERRHDALAALMRIGTMEAFAAVIAQFANGYESVRRTAVTHVSRQVGNPEVRGALVAALDDATVRIARNAARALAAGARASLPAVEPLLNKALSDSPVAQDAVAAIVAIGPADRPLPVALVPRLIHELNASTPRQGYAAAAQLARIGPPAIPAMMDMIRHERGMSQRAIYVLGEMGPAAGAVVSELKQHRDKTANALHKKMIAEALAKIEK